MTFGESSSLKRIGVDAFYHSGLIEIRIPDSVEEVCDTCFYMCMNLSRITFGQSSQLRVVGVRAVDTSPHRCDFEWKAPTDLVFPESLKVLFAPLFRYV